MVGPGLAEVGGTCSVVVVAVAAAVESPPLGSSREEHMSLLGREGHECKTLLGWRGTGLIRPRSWMGLTGWRRQDRGRKDRSSQRGLGAGWFGIGGRAGGGEPEGRQGGGWCSWLLRRGCWSPRRSSCGGGGRTSSAARRERFGGGDVGEAGVVVVDGGGEQLGGADPDAGRGIQLPRQTTKNGGVGCCTAAGGCTRSCAGQSRRSSRHAGDGGRGVPSWGCGDVAVGLWPRAWRNGSLGWRGSPHCPCRTWSRRARRSGCLVGESGVGA